MHSIPATGFGAALLRWQRRLPFADDRRRVAWQQLMLRLIAVTDMKAVRSEWIDKLSSVGLQPHYAWLQPLCTSVQKIVSFGCMTSEPFALLWMLDATEIRVVEIDKTRLYGSCGPIEDYEMIKKQYPEALEGRSITFTIGDMSLAIEGFQSNYFDLAYCDRVLYHMMPDLDRIQRSIGKMASAVKSGGIIIAADENIISGGNNRRGMAIDIGYMFLQMGLIRFDLPSSPEYTYCYKKL